MLQYRCQLVQEKSVVFDLSFQHLKQSQCKILLGLMPKFSKMEGGANTALDYVKDHLQQFFLLENTHATMHVDGM